MISAVMNASLKGIMNGAVTLVAIIVPPAGSCSRNGFERISNSRFE